MDLALDAGMDRLHEVVASKLGGLATQELGHAGSPSCSSNDGGCLGWYWDTPASLTATSLEDHLSAIARSRRVAGVT